MAATDKESGSDIHKLIIAKRTIRETLAATGFLCRCLRRWFYSYPASININGDVRKSGNTQRKGFAVGIAKPFILRG
jgi:hypothetical protein